MFLLLITGNIIPAVAQQAKHKAIAGTQYAMVPPKEFVPSKNISGFHHKTKDASIIFSEVPATPQSIVASFSGLSLKGKGMELLDKEDVPFDTAMATLMTIKQTANKKTYFKQALVSRVAGRTIMVVGTYPDTKMADAIRSALLSVRYDAAQKGDPLEVINFKLTVDPALFKLAMTYPGSMIYTTDGNINSKNIVFTASESFGKIPAADQKDFTLGKLRKAPHAANYALKTISPTHIDSLKGYEAIASGKTEKGRDESVYIVLLFDDAGKYYTMTGMAADDIEVSLNRFKAIAYTFRRKTDK
ncbi:MAG: hypothetical protein EOP56_05655 [Sphingobacteriales bacterium]|nr:MAG: hypothetical protein EOP56_05655 [Sphingobacteriales bacterium]